MLVSCLILTLFSNEKMKRKQKKKTPENSLSSIIVHGILFQNVYDVINIHVGWLVGWL